MPLELVESPVLPAHAYTKKDIRIEGRVVGYIEASQCEGLLHAVIDITKLLPNASWSAGGSLMQGHGCTEQEAIAKAIINTREEVATKHRAADVLESLLD